MTRAWNRVVRGYEIVACIIGGIALAVLFGGFAIGTIINILQGR